MIGSGGGGVGGPISPYSLPIVPRGTSGLTASGPLNKSQLSVSEMMGSNARGGPNISNVTDPVSGRRLTVAEAAARGPLTITGGSGRSRGYGGHGYQRPQSGVSSAGVAGGTPTSRAGRYQLAMEDNPMLSPEGAWADAERPAWDQPRPDPFAPNPRYGGMGRPPVRSYAEGTKDSGKKPAVSVVGERGPEALVLPPHSRVIPLTGTAEGGAAIDQIMGEVGDLSGAPTGIADGEFRLDADGNEWRYDASTGRGVMVNPYIANPNAPSPNAFRASPSERYADLAMRLDSLRQSGFAEGRAAVSRLKGQQAEEQAKREAFLATGKPIVPAEGGGTLYQTPYGPAIVGSNRPRSFTVENFEGGQTTSSDLAEVNRESRADAAERTVRGGGTRGYRALPGAVPSTVEDALPPAAVDDIFRAPSGKQPDAAPVAAIDDAYEPTDSQTAAAKKMMQDYRDRGGKWASEGMPETAEVPSVGKTGIESAIEWLKGGIEYMGGDLMRLPVKFWKTLFYPPEPMSEKERVESETRIKTQLKKQGIEVVKTDKGYELRQK